MAESREEQRAAIEALVAERARYDAWLTQLEAKRGATAAHVFNRVHADYSKRLGDVRDKLTAESDTVKGMVADLEKRLANEQKKVADKMDERAEAELRATVGEYTDDEWAAQRTKFDNSIANLRQKFDATERELVGLKELLLSIAGQPVAKPASAATSVEAAEPAPSDSAQPPAAAQHPGRVSQAIREAEVAIARETAEQAAVPAPGPAEPAPDEPAVAAESLSAPDASPAVDDFAQVDAVELVETPEPAVAVAAEPEVQPADDVGEATDEATDEAAAAQAAAIAEASVTDSLAPVASDEPRGRRPSSRRPQADEPPLAPRQPNPEPLTPNAFDELAFLKMVVPETPARGSTAVPVDPVEEPALSKETTGRRSARLTGSEATQPFGGPTPRTSQAIRSLKCGECGTLNFPTEWYCERCGGELAAF